MMSSIATIHNPILPIEGDRDSIFITCISYEERSVLATRNLSTAYKADGAVIFQSEEYATKGLTSLYHRECVNELTKRSTATAQTALFNIYKPIDLLSKLKRIIESWAKHDVFTRVTLDISALPRQDLLTLHRYIDSHPSRGVVRLLYGEPKKYATEELTESETWLTRGVRSVQSVPFFGGIQFPRRPKLLAIILGHEGERTHITLRRHQPDKLILIPQGDKQHHAGLREIAERENNQILSIYGADALWGRGLPSSGIRETEKAIVEIYNQHRHTHNMFLAPNGTKLQLVGAYLACRRIPEIQITYAVPSLYNWQNYSTGTARLSQMILEPPEY